MLGAGQAHQSQVNKRSVDPMHHGGGVRLDGAALRCRSPGSPFSFGRGRVEVVPRLTAASACAAGAESGCSAIRCIVDRGRAVPSSRSYGLRGNVERAGFVAHRPGKSTQAPLGQERNRGREFARPAAACESNRDPSSCPSLEDIHVSGVVRAELVVRERGAFTS